MGIAGIVILVILVIVALWVVIAFNGFVKMRNMVEEAFATMDVYMKKRYDLIPNLVETVKGYATHEASTLEKVVEARNFASNATSVSDKMQGENMLQGTLKSLFAISEAYPDLKANTNFLDLQSQLKQTEDDIANARKYYNAVVKEFNTKIEMFPNSVVATMFKFYRKPMFEVENEEERKSVQVKF